MLGERVYSSDKDVKYIFQEGNKSVTKLIVIFSGYAANNSTLKHKYNYINALNDFNVHKLFILDDNGDTGSYYFGENLNFNVDSSVISLIYYIARSYNIDNEDIITLGSSKGGTAALYFGLKYKLGAVFAGAFQTKISELITARRPASREFLLGSDNHPDHNKLYTQLNAVMFNLLKNPILSNLYLISSENDWQYKIHVEPFIKELNNLNIAYDLELSESMKTHSEISIYFPKYFKEKLLIELFNIFLRDFEINFSKNSFKLSIKLDNYSQNHFHVDFQYEVDSEIIDIEPNSDQSITIPGFYSFFLTVKNFKNEVIYKYLLHYEYLSAGKLEMPCAEYSIENEKLHFEVDTNSNEDLTYAFYIKENGKLIKKIMYQEKNNIEINIKEDASYIIQYFVKTPDGYRVVRNSNVIQV